MHETGALLWKRDLLCSVPVPVATVADGTAAIVFRTFAGEVTGSIAPSKGENIIRGQNWSAGKYLLYRYQLQVSSTCSRRCRLRLDRRPSCVLRGRHHHRTGRPAPALLPPSYIHEQSVQVGHTGSKPTKKGRLNFKSFYNTSVVPLLNKSAPLSDK